MGTTSQDLAVDIASDQIGNVYITGWTSAELDGNTHSGLSYDYDQFVVKFDSTGLKLWTIQNGTSQNEFSRGIAVDENDYIYTIFETWNQQGFSELSINKFDNLGFEKWRVDTVSIPSNYGEGGVFGTKVILDKNDEVIVTGFTTGTKILNQDLTEGRFVIKIHQ